MFGNLGNSEGISANRLRSAVFQDYAAMPWIEGHESGGYHQLGDISSLLGVAMDVPQYQ